MHLPKLLLVALFSLVFVACGPAPAPNGSYLFYPTNTPFVVALRPTKTSEPTARPTEPPTTVPVPTLTPEPSLLWRVAVTDTLYDGPSRNAEAKGEVANGALITLRAVRFIDGAHWYQVATDRGATGWVSIAGLSPDAIAKLPEDTAAYATPVSHVTTTPVPPTMAPPAMRPAAPVVQTGARTGAICGDGTRSSAKGRGACSHHGGVAQWLYK